MLDVFRNMKGSKRGRPPRKESHHIVWLRASTFKTWNERKVTLGFSNKSNNEFAEALLHCVFRERTQERIVQHTSQQRKCTETIVSPVPCE